MLVATDGRRYRVSETGVPILLDGTLSVFDPDDARAEKRARTGRRSVRRFLRKAVPSPTRSVGARARLARLVDVVLNNAHSDACVLIIGGGTLGTGIGEVIKRPELRVIETDVYLGPRTAVVCDAHQLPFAAQSFDAVIAQAVLEHVMDPAGVVAEAHRVLRPGGIVYAETPFMQQVHEGAYDLTRFTMVGHRRLFRYFDQLDAGVVCGPATAFVWALRYLVRSLPRRSHIAREALDSLVCIFFFWIKYLDDILITRAGASDGASGIYFLGLKREAPISDREALRAYSGSFKRTVSR
jgi:SAM-dependent methyltransferase